VALGAATDPDSTRHSWYCNEAIQVSTNWLSGVQNADGYWPEKNSAAPYTVNGVSPWRLFAVFRGLALTYDLVLDGSSQGCSSGSALAPSILTSLKAVGAYVYNFGYDTRSRGVHYDTQYPVDGLLNLATIGGTVSTTVTSPNVVGTGTHFMTETPAGMWIGITDNIGGTWTHQVLSVTDDTHLTLGTNWGTQCVTSYYPSGTLNTFCEPAITTSTPLQSAISASTTCGSSASFCGPVSGGSAFGDPAIDKDLIWEMGWLYRTTGDTVWTTRGDNLFAVLAGGPADGPGGSLSCSGPGCVSTNDGTESALVGCIGIPSTNAPCTNNNHAAPPGNAYTFQGKSWGQMDGVGGASNYLAWRLFGMQRQISGPVSLSVAVQ
jgi:hypothetical protein